MREGWEAVIGLEVHCELATRTKLFCACPNAFGAEPNTLVCPICLGQPGTLPVLNRRAVEFAVRIGLALHCEVTERCVFHRKNYFYPDMPKNYQISQYDEPICGRGWLAVPGVEHRIGIERAHLEEDTGKSSHVGQSGRIHESGAFLVDYNRAGVPLMEIVSAPDLRTADEARDYVAELREILLALGVSDVKMEEGSLRVDANVSVRRAGDETLGTRVEIKNMNSLRSLHRAVEHEITRQVGVVEAAGRVTQETRHFDEGSGATSVMRTKEEAEDYRYFPEPDLVPLRPPPEWIAELAAGQPELPHERRLRLVELGVPVDKVGLLSRDDDTTLADAVAAGADPATAVNWITGELRSEGRIPGAALADLLGLIDSGAVSTTGARTALRHMIETGGDARAAVDTTGVGQISDEAALLEVVDRVLEANPDLARRAGGDDEKDVTKAMKALMGRVMGETRGAANAAVAGELLRQRAVRN